MSFDDAVATFERQAERLLTIYKRQFERVCEANHLTATQFFAIFTIAEESEIRMSQLADRMGLTPGAVSTLVERLVDNGLVERRQCPEDRRSVFVKLTPRGQEFLESARLAKHAMVGDVIRRLEPEVLNGLNRTLGALLATWESQLAEEKAS